MRPVPTAAPRPELPGAFTITDYNEEKVRKVMAIGTVKWFNSDKGFGFIAPEGGGQDVFAHHTNIEGGGFRVLEDGARVEFEIGPGDKGPQALHIVKL